MSTTQRASARDRLLAAAGELFYEEGVHTVGIDRVIERAGVAKATLYNAFGSKDELVKAYLRTRHDATRARMGRELPRYKTPKARLVGVFEVQAMAFAEAGFRGCAFLRSSAEAPRGSSAEAAAGEYRVWIRSLFADLAREAGAANPDLLAHQLSLLYDGAGVSAWMDHDSDAALASRAAAATLVNAAIPD